MGDRKLVDIQGVLDELAMGGDISVEDELEFRAVASIVLDFMIKHSRDESGTVVEIPEEQHDLIFSACVLGLSLAKIRALDKGG